MSEFETQLQAARARRRRIFWRLAAALCITALLMALLFAFSFGTTVTVAPPEAAQQAQVRAPGFAFAAGRVVVSLSRTPQVEVRAAGFKTIARTIPAAQRGGVFHVQMQALPALLRAEVRAESAADLTQTRWLLGGALVEVGAALQRELPAGEYQLRAEHPHFAPAQREVQAARGETVQLQIALQAVQGELHLQSQPAGAEVWLNGARAGATPLQRAQAGGAYQLEIRHPKFAAIREQIEITHSAPKVQRNYLLAAPRAQLRFAVAPAGGALLVNGARTNAAAALAVEAGRMHTVAYFKDGYFPARREVTLAAGEQRNITLQLTQELGAVEITSQPPAQIEVEGRALGETPLQLELPAVPQRITWKRAGFRTITKTITPSGKSTTRLHEVLQNAEAARLAEAPNNYTNKSGIQMRLFRPAPRPFTIGAPEGERGRRANEFLRTVILTKPFYASRHEISNSQYQQSRGAAAAKNPKHPVTGITWLEAARFCNWLSAREQLQPFYLFEGESAAPKVAPQANGYRLLTEAEWEWLARYAGKPAPSVFVWGDAERVPSQAGNIADESARKGVADLARYVPNYRDGFARSAPVGSFPAEPSGLFDMMGNAGEWVHDFYLLRPPRAGAAAQQNPLGPEYGRARVIKGAGWRSGTRAQLRAAYKEGGVQARDDLGFRIGRYL